MSFSASFAGFRVIDEKFYKQIEIIKLKSENKELNIVFASCSMKLKENERKSEKCEFKHY